MNALYRGKRFLTPQGKAIKLGYALDVRNQWKNKILTSPVSVKIDLFFSDKRRRDIDGPIKAILDALTGVVYKDDSQIVKLEVTKSLASKPYFTVSVSPT